MLRVFVHGDLIVKLFAFFRQFLAHVISLCAGQEIFRRSRLVVPRRTGVPIESVITLNRLQIAAFTLVRPAVVVSTSAWAATSGLVVIVVLCGSGVLDEVIFSAALGLQVDEGCFAIHVLSPYGALRSLNLRANRHAFELFETLDAFPAVFKAR